MPTSDILRLLAFLLCLFEPTRGWTHSGPIGPKGAVPAGALVLGVIILPARRKCLEYCSICRVIWRYLLLRLQLPTAVSVEKVPHARPGAA